MFLRSRYKTIPRYRKAKSAELTVFGDAGVIIYNNASHKIRSVNLDQFDNAKSAEAADEDLDWEVNPPIGYVPLSGIKSGDVALEEGDRIVLFTDGFVHQRSENNQLDDSVLRTLEAYRKAERDDKDLDTTLSELLDSKKLADDTTFITLTT